MVNIYQFHEQTSKNRDNKNSSVIVKITLFSFTFIDRGDICFSHKFRKIIFKFDLVKKMDIFKLFPATPSLNNSLSQPFRSLDLSFLSYFRAASRSFMSHGLDFRFLHSFNLNLKRISFSSFNSSKLSFIGLFRSLLM